MFFFFAAICYFFESLCGDLQLARLLVLMMVRYLLFKSFFCSLNVFSNSVPLGNRRRFGPAPSEEQAPPQLAQPSPSAYPKPQEPEHNGKRGREESPQNGDPKGKPRVLTLTVQWLSFFVLETMGVQGALGLTLIILTTFTKPNLLLSVTSFSRSQCSP